MRPTVAALLLLACACRSEPSAQLVATPDKTQPAVAMVPPSEPQQVRPAPVVLVPKGQAREGGMVDPGDFEMMR